MIEFIDAHVHIRTGDKARLSSDPYVIANPEGMSDHPDAMAEMYRELKGMAVVFDIDDETRTGLKASNEELAGWVRKHPDVFIGFGTVDPWKGRAAIREVELCHDLGLRGVKFHPAVQDFAPNDPRFFPLWETCARLGLAVLFHTGTTMAAAGQPGGGGIRLEYGRPIPYIDDIAARFPDLRIIMAHPAWPWHEEQLAVLRHKPNVAMDLSGWAPKYIPQSVIHYANTLVQDKVFFGSDFPMLTPQRWLREFAELPIKDAVRPKILRDNVVRFLGLSDLVRG
ncbi:amidohydrolase family protein [Thermomicrobiaceae bacterium CFH 74404]|uniref:Amidohydrolase family protein n=1 Tax=Thermalbibacter longus TaxID=2951981 RepID=A0AA41WC35_9BACT|nr:amidohydrolase family protein [Thermalbibacter longus]MCM8750042.1 amidohydrolase family protein [Thermalbibacter longus]